MEQNKKPNETREIPLLANPAGELEQETKGRLWNLLEPVIMMSLLQIVMWGIWYPYVLYDENLGIKMEFLGLRLDTLSYILMGIMALFLFASPFIHKDTMRGWGLNPKFMIEAIKGKDKKQRAFAILITAIFVAIGMVAFFFLWDEIAGALFSMNGVEASEFLAEPYGIPAVLGMGGAAGFLLSFFVVRYDNFLNALKVALIIIGVLGGGMIIFGFLIGAPMDFESIDWGNFAINFLGYIFWGALQQFLFASYFGTRFRKAFSPSHEFSDPRNPTGKEERKLYLKRIWVSVISGSYFGLIHVPSWNLVLFTWVLGIFLSWLYMKDKNRNLLALGIIHGFLGSLGGAIFSSDILNLSVGPTTDESIALAPNFWIVAVFLILHQVIIVVAWYVAEKRK